MKKEVFSRRFFVLALLALMLSLTFTLQACRQSTNVESPSQDTTSLSEGNSPSNTTTPEGDVSGTSTTCDDTTSPLPPAVIIGTQSETVVYADDSTQQIRDALANGVCVDGYPEYKIDIKIYNADGEVVTEFAQGTYRVVYTVADRDAEAVETTLRVKAADITPPVIEGATDLIVKVGDTVSYRKNVVVSDNDDESVTLEIDAHAVDLTRPGTYSLTYKATDKRGNTASVTVSVVVLNADDGNADATDVCTREELDALCQKILSEIFTEGMTDVEKLRAIYDRVHKITYIGVSDKSNWVAGAYIGLTVGRGDCYNYWAASKALLTAAGFASFDLHRIGWTTQHFWQIVYVNGGWYHFDACPYDMRYPWQGFLLTESDVKAYSDTYPSRYYYYVYDYESCPYDIVD